MDELYFIAGIIIILGTGLHWAGFESNGKWLPTWRWFYRILITYSILILFIFVIGHFFGADWIYLHE